MEPVNTPLSRYEWLARTIYQPSQMKNHKLLKDCLWQRYKRESRTYLGFHEFRISVQRLCYGKWGGCLSAARHYKRPTQTLKGFKIARGMTVLENGFTLEPDASNDNPFHAHILVEQLKVPYEESREHVTEVMNSGVRRRLDNLTDDFEYVSIEDILNDKIPVPESCLRCL